MADLTIEDKWPVFKNDVIKFQTPYLHKSKIIKKDQIIIVSQHSAILIIF